tara:strand:+ start:225 stop:545 length:321 start_codon:yes stop_codon:yes gene_type:complete
MFRVGPSLSMAFKGRTPSELWERYDGIGGYYNLELDLTIAAEMNEQISEAHSKAEKSAKSTDAAGAVARRNQRRSQRKEHLSNTDDFFSAVEKAGVPVRRVSGDEK